MKILGTTKLLGVIGNPIAHSLSPVIQNVAIDDLNLNYVYVALPVQNNLQKAIEGMQALGFVGCNVTIPYKTDVMQFLDEISDDAKALGAVNTILFRDGKKFGTNTDVHGFRQGLRKLNFENLTGKNAMVLGAGGASRAILWSLAKENVQKIFLCARNFLKAKQLSLEFEALFQKFLAKKIDVVPIEWTSSNDLKKYLPEVDLLINATPIGMFPNVENMPAIDFDDVCEKTKVYDVIYTPSETKFLQAARKKNLACVNGVTMLVGQGAKSFSLWTGLQPNEAKMQEALENFLRQ